MKGGAGVGLYIGKMDRKWLSRVLIIMLADILGILGSYLLALWARFDLHFMDIPPEFLQGYLSTIWWWVLICLAVFWLCNLYNSIWRFVSVDALMRIILAYVILGGLSFGCVKLFHIVMPRSYYVWGLLCSFFITAGIRFFYRGVRYLRNRVPGSQKGTENVMIIGAGQAGRQLIREYAVSSHLNSRVACLIDDNPAKRGRILEGVRIVGGRRDIPQAVKRYDIRKIIFAIPSLQGAGRQEILNICSKTGCQIQVVPGIYQLVKGEVTISKLRRVELQDLLEENGFCVIAGAAFVAQHSIFTKVAAGRPDEDDRRRMAEFGAMCREKLSGFDPDAHTPIHIKGNRPYKKAKGVPFQPECNQNCMKCYACAKNCPTHSIPLETPWLTRTDTCISCGACIYLCPTQARGYRGPVFEVAAKGFEAMCAKRREPELFF